MVVEPLAVAYKLPGWLRVSTPEPRALAVDAFHVLPLVVVDVLPQAPLRAFKSFDPDIIAFNLARKLLKEFCIRNIRQLSDTNVIITI